MTKSGREEPRRGRSKATRQEILFQEAQARRPGKADRATRSSCSNSQATRASSLKADRAHHKVTRQTGGQGARTEAKKNSTLCPDLCGNNSELG